MTSDHVGTSDAAGPQGSAASQHPNSSDRRESHGHGKPKQPRNPWERFGWVMATIWLIFLVYPVLALLRSEAPTAWIVTGWAALVAFVVLYVVGFLRGMRGGGGLGRPPIAGQWLMFAGLIACALLSVPAEGGSALSFLPFIMSFASYGLTRLVHWITTIGAFVITGLCVILLPDGRDFLTVLAVVGLLGVVNTVSTWLIIRSSEAERLGLELATSEGREAVARDVHDLIGHSLTVVQLKAQLARRLIDSDPERAKAELAAIESLTAEAIAGVRATVSGVRVTTLAEQLASAEEVLREAGVRMRLDGEPGALSPAQALTASWILREATTNVLRHADARTVRVTIVPGSLSIADDGRGPGRVEGNGVQGMRERAAAAGAVLEFGPGDPAGTRVEVRW